MDEGEAASHPLRAQAEADLSRVIVEIVAVTGLQTRWRGIVVVRGLDFLHAAVKSPTPWPPLHRDGGSASILSSTLGWRTREASVESSDALEGASIDDEVGQGVEAVNGVSVADLGALNAEGGGLAVDAFGGGPLAIDGGVGIGVAVEGGPHDAAGFEIDPAAAAIASAEVVVVAGRPV